MEDNKVKSIIRLSKAVELLGLRVDGGNSPLVPTTVDEVNISCPCCAAHHSSGRRTLHMDFIDDWFSCPRCGFKGKTYKLISHFTGWPYDEVEAKVKNGELKSYVPSEQDMVVSEREQEIASMRARIAPIKQRHAVYEEFLKELSLSPEHREDLRRRGLSDEAIDKIGFKTLSKFMQADVIPQKLLARGLNLINVPGFGFQDGRWMIAHRPDTGYLIPYLNAGGLIEGFQIRYDHPSATIPKYGAFASAWMDWGTKGTCWVHCASDMIVERVNAFHRAESEGRQNRTWEPFDVILIEGGLKAYIVNHLTGVPVLAVPGVSSLKMIPSALQSLMQIGLRHVYIAYDMDAYSNPDVKRNLDVLCNTLSNLDIGHYILEWDQDEKGLDDYTTSGKFADILKQRLAVN